MALRALTPGKAAYCSECGAETLPDAASCARCGEPFEGSIQAVLCPICNSINPASAVECMNCNAKFPEPGFSDAPAPASPESPEEEYLRRILQLSREKARSRGAAGPTPGTEPASLLEADRAEGAVELPPRSNLGVPARAGVPGEGVRPAQGAGIGRRAAGRRIPDRHESRPRAGAGDREARGADAGEGAAHRRTTPCAERGGSRPRTASVGTGAEVHRGPRRVERRADAGHDQVRPGDGRPPDPDGPARGADGTPDGGAEPAHGAAEGTAQPERRAEGRHERHRRTTRRFAEGQDPEVREVGEVRALREAPRTAPAVVMADGTAREGPEVPRSRRGRERRPGPAEG